jgi:hypothetical protein
MKAEIEQTSYTKKEIADRLSQLADVDNNFTDDEYIDTYINVEGKVSKADLDFLVDVFGAETADIMYDEDEDCLLVHLEGGKDGEVQD